MTNQEFEWIVSTTKPAVLASIQRYLYDSFIDSIDDVAQETYIRIYQSILKNGLDKERITSIGNWAYTIAKNESIRFNMKNSKEWDKEQSIIRTGLKEDVPSFEEALLDEMEYEETMQSIPAKYKEVLELIREGKSGKEIAILLNIATGTVKSRLSRARSYINERFKNEPSNTAEVR